MGVYNCFITHLFVGGKLAQYANQFDSKQY